MGHSEDHKRGKIRDLAPDMQVLVYVVAKPTAALAPVDQEVRGKLYASQNPASGDDMNGDGMDDRMAGESHRPNRFAGH